MLRDRLSRCEISTCNPFGDNPFGTIVQKAVPKTIVPPGIKVIERVVWWEWQHLALVGGFILVLYLVPEIGCIFLLLPIFPPLMAILSFRVT